MALKAALVGNPNCGKTTLFNALTGSNHYVGNWPGVTVEKKEGKLRRNSEVTLVDLPGIYSLSPYTLEEVIARDYLTDERPDAIINIIDGTNLERNLYLTTQLIELGLPTLVVVNMMDLVEKKGDSVSAIGLAKALGCEVMEISALKGTGVEEAAKRLSIMANEGGAAIPPTTFSDDIEQALQKIEKKLPATSASEMKRFFAVKLFERDAQAQKKFPELDCESIIAGIEAEHNDDAESIIVNERYDYISSIIQECYIRAGSTETISDKIDRVVTNRWLALPIFVVVMFLVYFLSVTTVGTIATDWANDGVFGEGWFLGPGQEQYDEAAAGYEEAQASIDAYVLAAEEEGLDPESPGFLSEAVRDGLVASYDSYDDETGANELVEVDALSYEEALGVEEPDPSEYGIWIPGIPTILGGWMEAADVAPEVQALVLDGIVAGVGAVLGFVPQLLVLFMLLAVLEACGYLARVAFILDRVFRRFGLSGKSFIPMLIATGCGVPGVMASRTIENDNDRRLTVMTTTFMPCSAKLPIIALFAGAIFGGVWWVAPSAYFLGIAMILCSGIILKKFRAFAANVAPFVMELPAYHLPTVSGVLRSMGERTWAFIKKAGTIILLACIVIWFISSYGFVDGAFGMVENANDSILAFLGNLIAWIFLPLGWGDWQAASATVTGLIAKENVVSTIGILYEGGAGWYANVQAAFLPVAGYSFLAFNLLCAPCFAAIGAIRREMNSTAWFWAAIGYECALAYAVALMVYQLGGLLIGEVAFTFFTGVALAVLVLFLWLLCRPTPHYDLDDELRLSIHTAQEA